MHICIRGFVVLAFQSPGREALVLVDGFGVVCVCCMGSGVDKNELATHHRNRKSAHLTNIIWMLPFFGGGGATVDGFRLPITIRVEGGSLWCLCVSPRVSIFPCTLHKV